MVRFADSTNPTLNCYVHTAVALLPCAATDVDSISGTGDTDSVIQTPCNRMRCAELFR